MSSFQRLIGEQIRTIRTAKGMTQQQLADKSGFSDSYISDLERGQRNASLKTIERIVHALEISPGDLFNFRAIDASEGIEDKLVIFEALRSLLIGRRTDEIRYVYNVAKDYIKTVEKIDKFL